MITTQILGQTYTFDDGATLSQAARLVQDQYPFPILLAYMDNHLCELFKPIEDHSSITFLTYKDKIGRQAYQRSALLMLIKAFYKVAGKENIDLFSVDFAYGDGLFIQTKGNFILDEALLKKVSEKMKSYSHARLPFIKKETSRAHAISLFESYGMPEKASLFHYRLRSRVNLYSLGNFEDYFYGYMVENASQIEHFSLNLFEDGFLLRLPVCDDPLHMQPWKPDYSLKLFNTLKEADAWAEKLGVDCVGALNHMVTQQQAKELVLIQEALQEKKIGQIAEEIMNAKKKIVMIAGPSSSGKTTFSRRLSIQLKALGLKPHPISVDNYFVDRQYSPRHPDGSYNFECLECLDVKQLNQDLNDLLDGKRVQMPYYNFSKGVREYNGRYLTLKKDDILVIEGIHCLNDDLTPDIRKEDKYRIYISALSQFNIDEHNYIPTTDIRLLRRIIRDFNTRNVSCRETIEMWPSVRSGEEKHIFPYQENADIMFNSASVYELAVMKKYAQALLYGVEEDCQAYTEAKRLLRFLDFFLEIDNDLIPANSLIREFIGGSCFDV